MALADRYDCFLIDLDGVLYRGDRVIDGAPESLSRLRAARRRVVFVTNNSARTPEQVAGKLVGLGILAEPLEVVTSALATADLLAAQGGGTAFVIGEEGIRTALSKAGLTVLRGTPEHADHVVVGWDRSVDYAKLRTAAVLVERGSHLVATNSDVSYPAPDGSLWPGAGALLAVVTATTGRDAEIVGKPHAPLYEAALRRAGDGRALVVGDRLDTDIAGARALGLDSLLVLTGVSRRDDVAASGTGPTYVAASLSALFEDPGPRAAKRPGEGSRDRGYPVGWQTSREGTEMVVGEARKRVGATVEKLTPAKAQEMARSIVQGDRKEQVAKVAHDLMELSQKARAWLAELVDREVRDQLKQNRDRVTEFVDRQVKEQLKKNSAKLTSVVQREVRRQMKAVGVATKEDVDALRKRVRELERGGATPKRSTAKRSAAKRATTRKPAAGPAAPATS